MPPAVSIIKPPIFYLLIILFFLFANISLASDDKPGRFFEDQPDVNDDYQIPVVFESGK